MGSTLPDLATVASVAAALLYSLGTWRLFQSLRLPARGDAAPALPSPRTLRAVVIAGLLMHGLATFLQVHTPEGLYLGLFTAGSLIMLVMILIVVVASLYLAILNLLLLILPLSALLILASQFAQTGFVPRASLSAPLIAHILVSITAYSLLFMAACQAVMVAFQDHALKSRRSIHGLRLLPPLESMERLLFSLLWIGIVTLTLAIGTGFLFLENLFAQQVVHHTVLSIASWCVYAILLAGHHLFGWRSHTATYWTLIAFALLVLGYFGSKFVLEILLEPR